MEQSFYVISEEYVGPDLNKRLNSHTVWISTEPGRTNMSNEERIDGWLGTTNDWYRSAHGEYATLDEARAAVVKMVGENPRSVENDEFDEHIVESYAASKFVELDACNSQTLCYEYCSEITVDTTDERIDEILNECEEQANADGFTLDTRAVERMLAERRDELRANADNDDDA